MVVQIVCERFYIAVFSCEFPNLSNFWNSGNELSDSSTFGRYPKENLTSFLFKVRALYLMVNSMKIYITYFSFLTTEMTRCTSMTKRTFTVHSKFAKGHNQLKKLYIVLLKQAINQQWRSYRVFLNTHCLTQQRVNQGWHD